MFDVTSCKDGVVKDVFALLASKAAAQTPEVKIVNEIKALYNNSNQILKAESLMQLKGDIFCSQLDKIQTTQGNVYADDTLRLWENGREITLADFLAAYEKCGFSFAGNNNFLPKPGIDNGGEMSLDITDTAKSWDIYRLFERYHAAGKLASLSSDNLHAEHITVAGLSANGLYGSDNQPLATFPYKVKGEALNATHAFAGFENLYEYTGDMSSLPANTQFTDRAYKIKNFATKSQLPNNKFEAGGACFFQICSGKRIYPPLAEKANLGTSGSASEGGGEIAFASVAMLKSIGEPGLVFPYVTGYAKDSSGATKLIGTMAEGFDSIFASVYDLGTNNNEIYGVLELQDWTGSAPPAKQPLSNFPDLEKWTAEEFNSLLSLAIKPLQAQKPRSVRAGHPSPRRRP